MKILAHNKDPRDNELITFQFELDIFSLTDLLKFKKMEVTWIIIKESLEKMNRDYPFKHLLITLTSSKPALIEFFDKCKNTSTPQLLQDVAEQMYDLYNESEAVKLKEGEYHLPLLLNKELTIHCLEVTLSDNNIKISSPKEITDYLIKIAVSQLINPNKSYSELLILYNQLIENNELDTFVHCAKVMSEDEYFIYHKGTIGGYFSSEVEIGSYFKCGDVKFIDDSRNGWCENYQGFISYKNLI